MEVNIEGTEKEKEKERKRGTEGYIYMKNIEGRIEGKREREEINKERREEIRCSEYHHSHFHFISLFFVVCS